MSNYRYLEFDSKYRNRNQWPLPSEFEVPISMSGRKGQLEALDVVSTSVPVIQWTSYLFDRSAAPNGSVVVSIKTVANTVTHAGDVQTCVISAVTGKLQQFDGYYVGAVIVVTLPGGASTISRRIVTYKFLATNGAEQTAEITLSPVLPDSAVNTLLATAATIYDPTDLNDKTNPIFFVPGGNPLPNGFCNKILYNETRKQYRPILFYEIPTSLLTLNTSGSAVATDSTGPIPVAWTNIDNYSIRITPPKYPLLSGAQPTVLANHAIGPTVYVTTKNTVIINNITNATGVEFKNYALRIIPGAAGGLYYDYVSGQPTPDPLGESVVIENYIYDDAANVLIMKVSPVLDAIPAAGMFAEILEFSYDGFNPFIYDGSLVSQQQNVCYEIKLLNVILPNLTLNSGVGGRVAFYPYVYVTLTNASSSTSGPRNLIYSNNPNSSRVTFRAPVYDIASPLVSSFINLDGDGMEQTIKFKPNDNLYFSVTLPDGQLFDTVVQDTSSPSVPNPYVQISAAFAIRRVTNNPISKDKSVIGDW